MLVHKHPAGAALLPNSGVPEVQFNSLTVLRFFHQVHRNRTPGDHAAASHFQVLAGRQLDLRRTLQKLLLHAVVVLLPAVICKRRHIIKNESVVFGVELRRSVRRSRAPGRTIAVDKLAKGGVVRGLLLRPGSYESQQCTDYCQRHIQQPARSLSIFVIVLPTDAVIPYLLAARERDYPGDVPTRVAYAIVISFLLQALLFMAEMLLDSRPSLQYELCISQRRCPSAR